MRHKFFGQAHPLFALFEGEKRMQESKMSVPLSIHFAQLHDDFPTEPKPSPH